MLPGRAAFQHGKGSVGSRSLLLSCCIGGAERALENWCFYTGDPVLQRTPWVSCLDQNMGDVWWPHACEERFCMVMHRKGLCGLLVPAYTMNSGPRNGGCPGVLESAFTPCLMVLLSSPGLAKCISRVRHCILPLFPWCLHCWFLRSVRSDSRSETAHRGGVRPCVLQPRHLSIS